MPYKYAVAMTVAIGLFMVVLDNTIVNVALAAMQTSFGTDLSSVQWVITAYFLAQAAVIPIAGYLGSWFGQKRTYMVFLGIFTLGSLFCGLAEFVADGQTAERVLIAARVFQGIGGGALFPLATAISFAVFPPTERAFASAFVAVPVLVAPTLGPTVGGLIVDSPLGWPWIFIINVPVGLLALLMIARILRPDSPRVPGVVAGPSAAPAATDSGGAHPAVTTGRQPFDFVGLILSIVGVLLVIYAFTLVGQAEPGVGEGMASEVRGWGYWLFWTLLGAGVAVLIVFGLYETRVVKDPVLDLGQFRSYTFTISTVITWAVRGVVFGSFFLLPLYLQQYRGLTAFEAGLALMPQGLGAAFGVLTASRLFDIIGPRRLVVAGLAVLTLSTYLLVGIDTQTGVWDLAPILFIRGIGFGWGNLPLQTVALGAITGRALPKASSLYNASAQVFSSIGIAVLSTMFLSQITTQTNRFVVTTAEDGTALPADLPQQAGAAAASQVFWWLTIATALCIVPAFFLPAKSLKQQQRDQGEDPSETDRSSAARHPAVAE